MVQEVAPDYPRLGTLTSKQSHFIALVAGGHGKAEAYKVAFGRPELTTADACKRGCMVSRKPEAKRVLQELRDHQEKEAKTQAILIAHQRLDQAAKMGEQTRVVAIKKTLLTLNDRLSILAGIALSRSAKHGDKARAIEIYSKIAGDYAPQRMELTGADGQPIQTQSQSEVNVNVTQMSVRDRIARLRGLSTALNVTPTELPPATEAIVTAAAAVVAIADSNPPPAS